MLRKPHTILYVDDESANLTTFRYCFGDRFEVLVAQSGEEALALLGAQPVAVLLADQRMPGMTGAQLCQVARERFPDVVRMIVTAYADIAAAVEAINSGQVLRYISKPWREEQMAEVLRAGVEAYELGVLLRQLQVRMVQHEQQTTIAFALKTVLHELAAPAQAARGNLLWMVDSLRGLLQSQPIGTSPPPAALAGVLAAAKDGLLAVQEIESRLDRFQRGEPVAPGAASGADLARTVRAAVAIVGPELRPRAQLSLQLAELPLVAAESTQLSRILVNLLTNAVEAIRPGEPALNQVTVRTSAVANQVLLEVEDSGPGIPPELLPRIFEPFVSTKSDDPVRGFGLAVVRDLVQQLHGDVTVRSELGRGTCFAVTLPFA